MNRPEPDPDPGRHAPAAGVHVNLGHPTIVFVTVCAKDRAPWLACAEVHRLLVQVWRQAEAWQVGYFVVMPDHLHLFAAPHDLRFTIEQWLTYWKSQFSKAHSHEAWRWQAHAFHRRLRREESYTEKWNYVRENPLRAGLVTNPEAWPYQGMIHALRW